MLQHLINSLKFDPFLEPKIVYAIWENSHRIASCGPECYNTDKRLCACACNGRHHGAGMHAARRLAFAHVLALAVDSGTTALVTDDYIMAEHGNRQHYARTTF